MASASPDAIINALIRSSIPTVSNGTHTQQPPRFTMDEDDRVREATTLLAIVDTENPRSRLVIDEGIKVIDMCTYKVSDMDPDRFVRRTLFKAGEEAFGAIARSIIVRCGDTNDEVPDIEGFQEDPEGQHLSEPSWPAEYNICVDRCKMWVRALEARSSTLWTTGGSCRRCP